MSEPAAAGTTQTRPADLKGFLALPPAALCSTPPSWPLMKPQLQTCASARPQTAGPPCWSQPARTGTSKPGSSPRTPRVRPGEAGVARQRVACQLGCFSLTLRSPTLPAADGAPSWSCDFVGAYRSLVPECCCFSADGSLLAVGFQEVVVVWSPASWELLTTLSQPPNAVRSEHNLLRCFV